MSLRGAYGEVLMPAVQASETMRAWRSRYARLVLERCNRDKRQACRVLGITYHTLNAYLSYVPREQRSVPLDAAAHPDGHVPAQTG